MRFFSYSITTAVLLLLSLPLLSLFFILQQEADYTFDKELDQAQLNSIENILVEYDPRYFFNTSQQRIELNEAEINALLLYFTSQGRNRLVSWLTNYTAEIGLRDNTAILSGTIEIQPTYFGSFLNFTAVFQQQNNSLTLQELILGDLKIPAFMFGPLITLSQQELDDNVNYLLLNSLLNAINDIDLRNDYLALGFNWEDGSINSVREQARQILIDQPTRELLISYHRLLITTLETAQSAQSSISLNNLLSPLFEYALQTDGDPRLENQAILLVLSSYLLGELDIEDLIGPDPSLGARSPALRITLENRDDLPRHLVVSAAIAAYADTDLANIVSVYKEIQDSRTNSGFSFSDITADLIGTRIGEMAVQNQNNALQLQRFFSSLESERDYIPRLGQPDGISEAEFIAQYGDRNSEAYRNRIQLIEMSIAELAVFQDR